MHHMFLRGAMKVGRVSVSVATTKVTTTMQGNACDRVLVDALGSRTGAAESHQGDQRMDEMLERATRWLKANNLFDSALHGHGALPRTLAAFARSECLLQMEADCKAVCGYCKVNVPYIYDTGLKHHFHRDSTGNYQCEARPIREAMKKLEAEMEATG